MDAVVRMLAACFAGVVFSTALHAQALGSGFTYQGRLDDAGQAANGLYDLQACLFADASGPVPLACAPDLPDVPVAAGQFTIALDFGSSVFVGQQRFLEFRVRSGASTGGYAILAPRQLIRPAPESLRANVASASPWSGLSGVPAGFADGVDDTGTGGTVTQVGSGTGLSGGPITTSGTLSVDTTTIQARVTGSCVAGAYVRQVNANGSVVCGTDSIGSGSVTSVTAGSGLSGGTITVSGTLSVATGGITANLIAAGSVGATQIDPAQVQARVTGNCAIGNFVRAINADGSVSCDSAAQAASAPLTSSVGPTSIAIGTDGLPVIALVTPATELRMIKCSDAACSGPTSMTIPVGPGVLAISLVVPSDNFPFVAYIFGTEITTNPLRYMKCNDPACAGLDEALQAGNVSARGDVSAAIGAGGLPRVIFATDPGTGYFILISCLNASCTSSTTGIIDSTTSGTGQFNDLAVTAGGTPVVSYSFGFDNVLKFAACANATCTPNFTSILRTIDATTSLPQNSLAIGADGNPVIAYRSQPTTSKLRLARCNDPTCATFVLSTLDGDNGVPVGDYPSIAIGGDGFPVIAYRDRSRGTLKVLHCGDAACTAGGNTISTVDPVADAGSYASMAIGTDGLPIISHTDMSTRQLRLRKCASATCQ